jgi:hypothetical protein
MRAKPTRDDSNHAKDQVIKEARKTNTEDLTTLTYQLPKSTHQAFKAKVAGKGEKMKDVIEAMIKDYLEH